MNQPIKFRIIKSGKFNEWLRNVSHGRLGYEVFFHTSYDEAIKDKRLIPDDNPINFAIREPFIRGRFKRAGYKIT